ncbi:MAG: 3-oxoacid CoA-transferase subunit B [Actinomycetota bacterium]
MSWSREAMAARIAADIAPDWIINLGIGLPTLVAGYLTNPGILVHAENGILGVGPRPPEGFEDPDLVDPGKHPVTVVPGAAYMDSLMSFGLIRGGHLDLAVMGAYQVSQEGDLANWRLPGRRTGGIGGAADLAAGANRVWIAMQHTSKEGEPKLVKRCAYPLTARGVVSRVYTDLCVLEVQADGLKLMDLAPGVSIDDVRTATEVGVIDAGGGAG